MSTIVWSVIRNEEDRAAHRRLITACRLPYFNLYLSTCRPVRAVNVQRQYSYWRIKYSNVQFVTVTTTRLCISRGRQVPPPSCPCLAAPIDTLFLRVGSCIVTKSINASIIRSGYLFTKSSQPPNPRIFITSSLFNLLAALALHLSSPLLGLQHHPR